MGFNYFIPAQLYLGTTSSEALVEDTSSIQSTSDDNIDATSQTTSGPMTNASSGDCQCLGCSDPFTPHQPLVGLQESHGFRRIQPNWY